MMPRETKRETMRLGLIVYQMAQLKFFFGRSLELDGARWGHQLDWKKMPTRL